MKRKIIGILTAMIVLGGCGVGYFIYQENVKQEIIDKEVSKITDLEDEFSKTEQREEKILILESLIEDSQKYNKSEKVYKEVSE